MFKEENPASSRLISYSKANSLDLYTSEKIQVDILAYSTALENNFAPNHFAEFEQKTCQKLRLLF